MWILSALLFVGLSHALDSIEQAQTLALNKHRTEACAVLKRALGGTSSASARARLKEALAQIARVPFTEKGQRAFEAGQSLVFENPDGALGQLKEALVLEDGSLAVRVALAKVYLQKNDAASARAELKLARELNPYDAEAALLDVRALTGQREWDLARERAKLLPPLNPWQERFVQYLQAQEYVQQGQNAKAAEVLGRVVEEFPQFPEARYYLARAERPRAAETQLRRYVSLCQRLTARDRRTFALEPRLCANQKEAEDELAKKSVDL